MKLGLMLRNMGPEAGRELLLAGAGTAEATGIDSLWVADHIAIPPDQAEGSDGRYLDPLATLAFLAAATERIGLGAAVLILPYRPPLPTAKWIATLQELSRGRLLLGVGAGWMEAEFRALGVPRSERGARTDATLDFLERCFAEDVVESHGQPFLFRPRPPRPPILVGGTSEAALRRAVRYGDAWMPMGDDPEKLRAGVARLRALADQAGRAMPDVVLLTRLPLADPGAALRQLERYREVGVSGLIHAERYASERELERAARALVRLGDRG